MHVFCQMVFTNMYQTYFSSYEKCHCVKSYTSGEFSCNQPNLEGTEKAKGQSQQAVGE